MAAKPPRHEAVGHADRPLGEPGRSRRCAPRARESDALPVTLTERAVGSLEQSAPCADDREGPAVPRPAGVAATPPRDRVPAAPATRAAVPRGLPALPATSSVAATPPRQRAEGPPVPRGRRPTAPTVCGSLRLPLCVRHRERVALPSSRRAAQRTSGAAGWAAGFTGCRITWSFERRFAPFVICAGLIESRGPCERAAPPPVSR